MNELNLYIWLDKEDDKIDYLHIAIACNIREARLLILMECPDGIREQVERELRDPPLCYCLSEEQVIYTY